MKVNPKKAMLIGLAACTLFGTTSCGVEENVEPDVYGPPSDIEVDVDDTEEETTAEDKNSKDDKTDTEEVTVDDNEPSVVYGPPTDE